MVVYLCVLIVFLLYRESLKLILVDEPLPEVVLSQGGTKLATLHLNSKWAQSQKRWADDDARLLLL
jgi:hypothetical protein